MHVLLQSVSPTLQQATTNPHLHRRFPDPHRQVWDSLLWGQCSFLLGPGAQGSVGLPRVYFPVLCKFWQLYGGLMATSSKRAYPIPKSAAPRAPVPVAVHCWPVPPQEMLKHSSVSVFVGSLGPGVKFYTLGINIMNSLFLKNDEKQIWIILLFVVIKVIRLYLCAVI